MTATELESLYAQYRRSVGDLERGRDAFLASPGSRADLLAWDALCDAALSLRDRVVRGVGERLGLSAAEMLDLRFGAPRRGGRIVLEGDALAGCVERVASLDAA